MHADGGILREVASAARLGAAIEVQRINNPPRPGRHCVRAAIRSRGAEPVVARVLQLLNCPAPLDHAVVGLWDAVASWQQWTAAHGLAADGDVSHNTSLRRHTGHPVS